MNYDIIIFDADETLFDFKKSEQDAFKQTIIEYGIVYEKNLHFKVYKEINTAMWLDLEKGLITQKKLKIERFKKLSDKLDLGFDAHDFAKSYMKNLSYASFLYDDSLELVESLHKDYRLTIITNGLTDVQDRRIRKSTIAHYFEDIVISEEIKVSKPNPQIFEIALKNINYTNKEKVLMVGDNLSSDIQGGINFGIDTCWYNPNKVTNETDLKPTYEVSSLMNLKDMLKQNI